MLAGIILMPEWHSVRDSVRKGGNKKTGNGSLFERLVFVE